MIVVLKIELTHKEVEKLLFELEDLNPHWESHPQLFLLHSQLRFMSGNKA